MSPLILGTTVIAMVWEVVPVVAVESAMYNKVVESAMYNKVVGMTQTYVGVTRVPRELV